MDAYCPHLGAHLGVGGRVDGDELVCPFHGWRFNGAGSCVHVPYAARPNPRAQVGSYRTAERNGQLLVWYDSAGRPPSWEVPIVPEFGDRNHSSLRRNRWIASTKWYEIKENVVDTAHSPIVHRVASPRCTVVQDAHRLTVTTAHRSDSPLGNHRDVTVTEYHGPGVSIVRVSGSFDLCMITGNTPIEEDRVDVRVAFVLPASVEPAGTELADLVAAGQAALFDEDLPIWENKAYIERPALVPEDGPIMAFRRWAAQFDSAPSRAEDERSVFAQ
jgi:hypothetical protein